MATSFTKIYSDEIVDSFQKNLASELQGSCNIYLAEEYKRQGNRSIRINPTSQTFNEINSDRFLNTYELEIKLYYILNMKNDTTYKDFFNYLHRIEQFILAYQSVIFLGEKPLNFQIDSISINDIIDDEVNVNGLQTATFNLTFSKLKG